MWDFMVGVIPSLFMSSNTASASKKERSAEENVDLSLVRTKYKALLD